MISLFPFSPLFLFCFPRILYFFIKSFCAHSISHSLNMRTLSLSLSHSLTHTLSLTHSLSHTHSISLTQKTLSLSLHLTNSLPLFSSLSKLSLSHTCLRPASQHTYIFDVGVRVCQAGPQGHCYKTSIFVNSTFNGIS